jgi:hypothetical protein
VIFAAIILCVAVYFLIDSVRKLLDTPSYVFFFFASEETDCTLQHGALIP